MSYDADITIVLDRSGSMASIKGDTIGGFNTFLEEQQKNSENIRLSLVQFDYENETVYNNVPLKEVQPLTEETFRPRGSTALLDTLGEIINRTGQRFSEMKEGDRPSKVMFVIITDGHENASKEFNRKQIFDMIKHQTDKYSWDFLFLGANQDAIDEGAKYGISADMSMTYAATSAGVSNTFKNVSASVTRNMRGFAPGFTPEERASSMAKDDENE